MASHFFFYRVSRVCSLVATDNPPSRNSPSLRPLFTDHPLASRTCLSFCFRNSFKRRKLFDRANAQRFVGSFRTIKSFLLDERRESRRKKWKHRSSQSVSSFLKLLFYVWRKILARTRANIPETIYSCRCFTVRHACFLIRGSCKA